MNRRDVLKAIGFAPVVGLPALAKPEPLKATLVMQPMPTHLHMTHTTTGGRTITSILRTWRANDVPRCKLCPVEMCMARRDGLPYCLVTVSEHVKPGLPASLYSVTDLLAKRSQS